MLDLFLIALFLICVIIMIWGILMIRKERKRNLPSVNPPSFRRIADGPRKSRMARGRES